MVAWAAARAAAASGLRPHTPANSMPGCAASAGPWVPAAQGPVPRSPMRGLLNDSVMPASVPAGPGDAQVPASAAGT